MQETQIRMLTVATASLGWTRAYDMSHLAQPCLRAPFPGSRVGSPAPLDRSPATEVSPMFASCARSWMLATLAGLMLALATCGGGDDDEDGGARSGGATLSSPTNRPHLPPP